MGEGNNPFGHLDMSDGQVTWSDRLDFVSGACRACSSCLFVFRRFSRATAAA